MKRLTRHEKAIAGALIRKRGIGWFKLNHIEMYRKLKVHPDK